MTKIVYRASLNLVYVVGFFLGLGVFGGYLENGYSVNIINASFALIAYVALLFIDRRFVTRIVIKNNTLYKHEGFTRTKSAPIQNIISIERFRQFYGSFFKKEGSRIRVTYLTESSEEKNFHIREKQYDVKTLKALFLKLKEIKPSLKLSKQYEDLLAGKYDGKNFHRIPAEEYGVETLDN